MQSKRKVHKLTGTRRSMPFSGSHAKTECGTWLQMNYAPDERASSETWDDVTCKNCLKKRPTDE